MIKINKYYDIITYIIFNLKSFSKFNFSLNFITGNVIIQIILQAVLFSYLKLAMKIACRSLVLTFLISTGLYIICIFYHMNNIYKALLTNQLFKCEIKKYKFAA